jgi:hypothetical protein
MNGSKQNKGSGEESKLKCKRSVKAADKVKKKKKKKVKDPDAPKRPLGPYFFYFKEYNTLIKQENPNFIQKEVVAKIAVNWKALNEDEKAPYIEKSKEDKERYVREKAVYEEVLKEREESIRRKEKKKKYPTSTSNKYKNGGKRQKIDHEYPHFEEKEVRLAEIIGEDQIDFPSDSEVLAPYSPPDNLSNDGSKSKLVVVSKPVSSKEVVAKLEEEKFDDNEAH